MQSSETSGVALPRSLAGRVAAITAAIAAIAALLAAAISFVLADRLVAAADDRRLLATAALSLRELHPFQRTSLLATEAAKEVAEFAPASISLVVREHDRVIAGMAQLPQLAGGTCGTQTLHDRTLRCCAAEETGLAVVAATAPIATEPGTLVLSCAVSAAIAALLTGFAGRRAARWALDPLTRLGASLATVGGAFPDVTALPVDDRCDEVTALRLALLGLIGRLGHALEAARTFSAEAAHELKTPLTAIRAELELLAEEPLGSSERAGTERVLARVAVLGTLVDRLLLLAVVPDDALSYREAVSLEEILRGVVGRLPKESAARVVIGAGEQGMVRGDDALLTAVVDNVIDNALKFSGERPVEASVGERSGEVTLDVRDYGAGIAGEARERAFEPFFRSAEARGANTRGHGVGLAIVARVAAAHGGKVSFVDVTDARGGAHLRVALPSWRQRVP